MVTNSDGSLVGYANRMTLLKREVGEAITIADNTLLHRFKDGEQWDAQIITDTSYCDFQVKGEVGVSLNWHTDLDMIIVES